MTKRLFTVTAVVLVAATSAFASIVTDTQTFELPMHASGVLVVDNPHGNVHVVAGDAPKLAVRTDRVINARDRVALYEARKAVQRIVEGTEKTRVLRTLQPATNSPTWSVQVHYRVTIPRTAHVKIVAQNGGIRVDGVAGQVSVKNVNGPILINDSRGEVRVENINGDLTFVAPSGLRSNVVLASVNGSIVVRAPADAKFNWEAETLIGDAQTTFQVRGGQFLSPTRFHGSINAPGDVKLVTQTFAGNILLLPIGAAQASGKSVHSMARSIVPPKVGPMLPNAKRGHVRMPLVQSSYRYETAIGDVRIDEIRGTARIVTGAGEVHLGAVFGHCEVVSHGGPLSLGDITGVLTARTAGGNISVQRAREGGTIETGGGTIQVEYTGGPTQVSSGGGDIFVRRALDRVNAETRSGDIFITLDRNLKSERVAARTAKGNVVLSLPKGFAADVDAVVVTSDPNVNSIRSEFPGLSIQREQVGGKTRIRATGKINGGGQRLELEAHDGGVQIVIEASQVSPSLPR